jgi:hypothetical protein
LKQPIVPNQEALEAQSSLTKHCAIVESSSKDNNLVVGEEDKKPPPLPSLPPAAVFNLLYAKAPISLPSDLALMAVFIRNGTIYKDQEYIANLWTTKFKSKGNLDNTERMISRLFCCLNAPLLLHFLAAEIQVPKSPDLKIHQLFLKCHGLISEPKKEVLNAALILFAESFFYMQKYAGVDVAQLSGKQQADVSRLHPIFVSPSPILGAPHKTHARSSTCPFVAWCIVFCLAHFVPWCIVFRITLVVPMCNLC